MKNINLLIISVIISFVFLFSCQLEKTENQLDISKNSIKNEKKVVKLRWMGHWYKEGNKDLMIREMAREFSLYNQDIEFQLEFPDQIFKVKSDMLYEIQSDSIAKMAKADKWPFDILFCDQARYARVAQLLNNQYWGKEYLLDFSKESWFVKAHKDNFFDDGTYLSLYGGIAPGPYIEGFANVLYTSAEVEKMLGIEVKKTDMTYDDFASYAKTIFEYNKSHTEKVFLYSTQQWHAATILFTQLAMSEYGKREPASKQEAIEVIKNTYEALEKLVVYKPLEQYEKATPGSRVLYQNKYLFTLYPSWMYILWQMSNPEGVKYMFPAELPSFKDHKSVIYSGGYNAVFVVPKHAEHVEEAVRFIKYLSTGEMASKWSKYSKCPTALKSNLSYTDFGQDAYTKYYQHIQQKYGNNQLEIDLSSLFFKKDYMLDFKVEDVMNGQLSANDAINSVLKQTSAK